MLADIERVLPVLLGTSPQGYVAAGGTATYYYSIKAPRGMVLLSVAMLFAVGAEGLFYARPFVEMPGRKTIEDLFRRGDAYSAVWLTGDGNWSPVPINLHCPNGSRVGISVDNQSTDTSMPFGCLLSFREVVV